MSSGRAFRGRGDADANDGGGDGGSAGSAAGADLIRILAMAICPYSHRHPNSQRGTTPNTTSVASTIEADADAAAGGAASPTSTAQQSLSIADSTAPLAFSLSYADRAELVRMCADHLVLPEYEDDHVDGGDDDDDDDGYDDEEDEEQSSVLAARRRATTTPSLIHDVAIPELRTALLGFADLVALNDTHVACAHRALANVAAREGRRVVGVLRGAIQWSLGRNGGGAGVDDDDEDDDEGLEDSAVEAAEARAGGEIVEDLIVRHNGSRYYADGAFTRAALRELSDSLAAEAARGVVVVATTKKKGCKNDEDGEAREPDAKRARAGPHRRCNPHRLSALLRDATPLFYFLLEAGNGDGEDNKPAGGRRGEGDDAANADANSSRGDERAKMAEMIGTATTLLYYPVDLKVVRAAAGLVALALSYDGGGGDEGTKKKKKKKKPKKLKQLFMCVRKALVVWGEKSTATRVAAGNHGGGGIVEALQPLIVTASRQSPTFALNVLSLAIAAAKANANDGDGAHSSGFDHCKLASLGL